MKKLLISASLVASAVLPSAAHAQAISPAVIAVVDLDQVTADCTACKTALRPFALKARLTRPAKARWPLRSRPSSKSLQAAVNALNGKEPDAALKARITAFQNKQQQGAQSFSASSSSSSATSNMFRSRSLTNLPRSTAR